MWSEGGDRCSGFGAFSCCYSQLCPIVSGNLGGGFLPWSRFEAGGILHGIRQVGALGGRYNCFCSVFLPSVGPFSFLNFFNWNKGTLDPLMA